MAISSSKSKTLTSSNNHDYTLNASFKENSTNTANNTSNVTVTAKLSATGYYWSTSYNSTLEIWWYDNNNYSNGTKVKSISFAGLSSTSDTKTASGSINVTHKSDGTLKGYAKAVFTKGSTTSAYAPASGNVSTSTTALTNIPRQANVTNADNFDDTQNPSVYYSNPAGNSVTSLSACISLTGSNDDVPYRDIPKTGTSYVFNLTEQERNTLRNATPNSNTLTVYFYVRTIIGNNYYFSRVARTMTIVDAYPTFLDFDYYDSNNDIVAITGNNHAFVKGYSNLVVSIPSADKMVTTKGATPNQYVVTVNDKNTSIPYSSSDISVSLGTLLNGDQVNIITKAYDSRNNWTGVMKQSMLYDYNKPVIHATIVRDNNYENTTRLNVNGKYSLLTINNMNKNTLTNLQYRYRETNGTWGNWNNLNPTLDNGNYSCSEVVLSLDNHKSFEFEIRVIDNIDTTVATLNVDEGKFIFFISTNKKCYIDDKEVATLDSVYPVGSIYMTVNNTNPSTLFGGTWEQIKDKFILSCGDTYSSGSTGGNATINLQHSHTSAKHSHGRGNLEASLNFENGYVKYYYDKTQKPAYNYQEKISFTESTASGTLYGGTRVVGTTGETTPNNTGDALSTAQSILPPYLAVYVWKRTA